MIFNLGITIYCIFFVENYFRIFMMFSCAIIYHIMHMLYVRYNMETHVDQLFVGLMGLPSNWISLGLFGHNGVGVFRTEYGDKIKFGIAW